jgi:hypothetical protein
MQSTWRVLLALLCICLVVAGGTIQAVHTHPQGDITHSDCSLCVTAHMGQQVAQHVVVLHVTTIASPIEAVAAPSLKESSPTFALFTRPPPVVSVLA